jgi:hypothetical protein
MLKILFAILGSAKFLKLLTTGGSMLLSVVLYAFVLGWR